MKRKDLHFIDEDKSGYSFIKACLNNLMGINSIKTMLKNANTTEDFVKAFLNEEKAKKNDYYKTQCYQVMLSKYLSDKIWYYCREQFGNDCHHGWADAGSLKVGNNGFSVLFHSGNGDGEVRYCILDKADFYAEQIMEYDTLFEVKAENVIGVYAYDCGNEIDTMLSPGRYQVYHYKGLVALVKLKN